MRERPEPEEDDTNAAGESIKVAWDKGGRIWVSGAGSVPPWRARCSTARSTRPHEADCAKLHDRGRAGPCRAGGTGSRRACSYAAAPGPTTPRPDPPAKPLAPEPPKALPRPLPAPVAAVPPRPVASPVSAAVIADRARALALIGMTAKGAEAEAECQAAIRSGATVEQYEAIVAARSILDAMAADARSSR